MIYRNFLRHSCYLLLTKIEATSNINFPDEDNKLSCFYYPDTEKPLKTPLNLTYPPVAIKIIESEFNWTYLLIPLKCMKNQDQLGQVLFRITIFCL